MYPTQAPYQPMPPRRTKVPTWAKLLAVGIPVFVILTCGLFLWLVPGSNAPGSAPAADPVVTTASPVGPRGDVTEAFRAWLPTVPFDPAEFSMVTAVRTDAHGYGIAVETSLYPKPSIEPVAVHLCQVASMYSFDQLGGFRTVWIGDQAGNVLVSRREVGGGCDWRR